MRKIRKINVIKEMEEPLTLEKSIGLEVYFSKNDGIGGKIKVLPEDFLVEEVLPEGEILELENGENAEQRANTQEFQEYIHFTLKKYNWDTIRAIKEISKRLRVSRKRLGFAGTKDKRAWTTQRVSLWNKKIEDLLKVKIKDIEIRNPTYGPERINLGNLWGNRFTITIRGISLDAEEIKSRIDSTIEELHLKIPGFFGTQRFGTQRPITHLVGKEILKRNFKEAVMIYLAKDFPEESEEAREVRRFLKKTEDFKEALKKFPKYLGYENAMLNHLAQVPTDYIGALRRLPKKLRWLFIHAYQAYIFNKSLSAYIHEGEKINEKDKLPLVGYETQEPDEVTKRILEEEGISPKNFQIKEMPEMSSKGEYRKTFFEIKDFKLKSISDDNLHEKKKKAIIQFSLPKGSYATVLLREIMKK